MAMTKTNPSQESSEARDSTPFTQFKNSICEENENGTLKAKRSFNTVIELIVRLTNAYPNYEAPAVKLTADLFNQTTYDVKQSLAKYLEQQETAQGYRDALDSLAPKFDVDFEIEDVLPPAVAKIIKKSCDQGGSDWRSSVFMLLATTGSLLGSKLMGHSRKPGTGPIPLNLYVFNCGDSSSDKSLVTKRFTNPLNSLRESMNKLKSKALEQARELTEPKDQKREVKRIQSSNTEFFSEPISFTPEGVLRDVCSQASRAGLHIHQDEGSDLLDCNRYGNGGGGVQSMGLFIKTLVEAWTSPLSNTVKRANTDNNLEFQNQTISLTANLQLRFISDILDFAEDSMGWTSRCIVVQSINDPNAVAAVEEDDVQMDPVYEYLATRLIPWCYSIQPHNSNKVDLFGNPIDYEVLRLDKYDGAQQLYQDAVREKMLMAADMEAQGQEAGLRSYLKKVGVRLIKFAVILHVIETLVDKKFHINDGEIGPMRRQPACDPLFELKKIPISKDTMERALMLEALACNQYQTIADICRAAPAKREEELKREGKLVELERILDKIKECPVNEATLKNKLKGSRGLTRAQITTAIEELQHRGCISREKPQGSRSFFVSYIKPLR